MLASDGKQISKEIEVMAGKVGRPKNPEGEGTSVRIETALAKMARRVADSRGIKIRDYLSDTLRPTVVRDFKQINQQLEAELEKKKK